MKALSLWQPWATLIAIGAKRIETRGWSTHYRGPLAIHASKGGLRAGEYAHVMALPEIQAALSLRGSNPPPLPRGAIVALVDVTRCRPVEDLDEEGKIDEVRHGLNGGVWTERDMGDYSDGRFGLVLDSLMALAEPVPFSGSQGFFDVPETIFRSGGPRLIKPAATDLFNPATPSGGLQ